MTNQVLDNNLRLLKKYNGELAQKIANITELTAHYEIKDARSGDSVLYKDNQPVDDPVDPVWKVLEEYKNLKFKTNKSITFALGMGLGYRLKELSKRVKGKLILHEPDNEFLRVAFELVDFTEELQNPNIRITNTYTDIERAYDVFFFLDYKPNMLSSNYYLNGNKIVLNEIKNKIQDIHGIYQSNYTNFIKKNPAWTYLLFNNIPKIVEKPDLHVLKNKFRGKPAVVISAGPSLDKNIEDLKPYRDNVVVFCVGTALKTALKHGIIPDFAVVVEVNKATKIQLDVPEIADINVITTTNVFPGVYNLNAKRFFNYQGLTKPATKWLGGLLQVNGNDYKEAGTVSLTAFYSAKMLGCDRVIFIGQDLAYTDNKCYSQDSIFASYKVDTDGVKAENTDSIKKELDLSDENIKKHEENLSKNLLYVKSYDGGKVLTRIDMLLFIKYFEDISEHLASELTLVNATEGGAFLKGYEHISLKEALEKYSAEEVVDCESILKTMQFNTKEVKKRKKIVLNALYEVVRNYNRSREFIDTAFEQGIVPYFQPEINEYIEAKEDIVKHLTISKKRRHGFNITAEETEFTKNFRDKNKKRLEGLNKKIDYLFENETEKFTESLKIVKDNYTEANRILSSNAYLHNMFAQFFMISNNLIKDFDDQNGCLKCLSRRLNHIIVSLYFLAPYYISEIKQIISELER